MQLEQQQKKWKQKQLVQWCKQISSIRYSFWSILALSSRVSPILAIRAYIV